MPFNVIVVTADTLYLPVSHTHTHTPLYDDGYASAERRGPFSKAASVFSPLIQGHVSQRVQRRRRPKRQSNH